MKLDHKISRVFQEMSLSELDTLHQLCELERTQILQSLALAVLKEPYAGYLLSGNRSNFLDYERNIFWFYTCTKKRSPLYVSQFNHSDVETPDEFADFEPSSSTHTQTNSSTFSKPPFQPIQPQNQCTSPYTPSQVTPTYSPFHHEQSINNSPNIIKFLIN